MRVHTRRVRCFTSRGQSAVNTFRQLVTTGVNLSLPSGALSTSLRASQALEGDRGGQPTQAQTHPDELRRESGPRRVLGRFVLIGPNLTD